MLVVSSSLEEKISSPLSVPKGMNLSTLRAVQPTVKRHMKVANWRSRPAIFVDCKLASNHNGLSRPYIQEVPLLAIHSIHGFEAVQDIIYQRYQLICIIILPSNLQSDYYSSSYIVFTACQLCSILLWLYSHTHTTMMHE